MLKYILALFFSFFILISFLILGCSDGTVASSSNSKPLSITRAPAAEGVDITNLLAIEFSADIEIGNIIEIDSTTPIQFKDTNENFIDASISLDSNNSKKVLIRPNLYLQPSSTYTIVVTTDLQDIDGNSLSSNAELTFTTSELSLNPGGQISFVDINPKDVATVVDPSSAIAIEFDRFIAPSNNNLFTVSTGGSEVLGSIEQFNSKATFIPSSPLSLSTVYDINITNPPTDLYGNEYNQASGMNWSFTTSGTEIGNGTFFPIGGSSVNVGTAGYLLCYYPLGGGDQDMIAVAKDSGIDFYYIDAGTFVKQPFSLSIASAVTEMVFVDGTNLNDALLISTMSDGIYKVQTNGTTSTVSRYLESETDIYGIGYAKDGGGAVDRVYAVGPQMGMKIFTVDGSGDMTFDKTVIIDGEPLKVVGYTYNLAGLIRKTYVSDYTNGVRVFDENGTSPSLVTVSGNVKHIAYADTTVGRRIFAVNSIGNIYGIDADTPITATFKKSIFSNVNDIHTYSSPDLYISTLKDGFFIYDSYMGSTFILLKSSGNIVSSIDAGGSKISLDSDGTLNIYGPS